MLPSGLKVLLRRVPKTRFALMKSLPVGLLETIDKGQKGAYQAIVENSTAMQLFLDEVTRIVLVKPELGGAQGAGHLQLEEIPWKDKWAIFGHVLRDARENELWPSI
jgi:hypothetical protein